MKKFVMTAVLATVLFAGACENNDGGPAAIDTRASIRFVNATSGLGGLGTFTTNGQVATGSTLAFGQATPTCTRVGAGTTSFGFGVLNAAGTALNGGAMGTLANQTIVDGGNFTLVALGSAVTHTVNLHLLDNNFSGTLGANQAAVRFVNLAAGTTSLFNVLTGTLSAGNTAPHALNLQLGTPSPFVAMTSGSNAFSVLYGHDPVAEGSSTLNLQAGSVNTIAIMPTSAGYQLVNLQRCS